MNTNIVSAVGRQQNPGKELTDAENREIFNLVDAMDFAAGFFVSLIVYKAA